MLFEGQLGVWEHEVNGNVTDCDGIHAVGADIDGRSVDRCRLEGRDGRDKWDGTLPRAPRIQSKTVKNQQIEQLLTLFQGTAKRSQQHLELEIENMGAHLNAYTSVSVQVV